MPKTLPVAFAVAFDPITQTEVFRLVDLTPEQLRDLVQSMANRLDYHEADALPAPFNQGVICADGKTGDNLKGRGCGFKGKYV
ncbi:MAG: hypothetical protein EBU46_14765 [Nitrosomonadaceae bacterium]|nr:hypothetical protein [Nitrosomonadaceae bacterium]